MKNPVLILALAISGGAMALGLWSWQQWVKTTAGASSAAQAQVETATLLPQARPLPGLELIDQDGNAFMLQSLEGDWSVLFFGFTNCPDICPNTLALLKAINTELQADGYQPLQMVFVSVDPQRDSPEILRAYVRYFDPNMLGLTGSPAALEQFSAALYLPIHISEPDASGHYNVDHSGSLVLVDPDSQVRAYFTAPHTLDAVLKDLISLTQS